MRLWLVTKLSRALGSTLLYSVNRPLVRSLADARQESVVTHHRIIMEEPSTQPLLS